MVLYAFRLTDSDVGMLNQFLNWLLTGVDRKANPYVVVHFVCFEISKHGKEHIHALLDIKVKSSWVQAMHVKFCNRWVGNKYYSCELLKKEPEHYLRYMSKGIRNKKPEIWHKMACYTDEMVDNWYAEWWRDKPIENDKTLLRKPTIKKPTWSEELTKLIVKDNPGRHWRYNAHDVDDLIEHYVMPFLGQGSKKLTPKIISELVMGQLNALSGGRCESLNALVRRQGFPDLFG